ncbi:MAG: hypothetical protein JKY48_12720 [Flavobacteriales bacterium]|nr:hypothetical protein [Flavobacteriales bacterium]
MLHSFKSLKAVKLIPMLLAVFYFTASKAQADCNCQIPSHNPCFTIPVIIHIVHDPMDSEGVGTNLSCSQICSQMQVLKEDFGKTNLDIVNVIPEFTALAADTEVEFDLRMVLRTPDAPCGPPNISLTDRAVCLSPEPVGTEDYLHIWVVKSQNVGLACPIEAEFHPKTHCARDANSACVDDSQGLHDGVFIGYKRFGRGNTFDLGPNSHLGRVATHEIGHWLGIPHPGDSNGPNGNQDCIYDTPCQEDATPDIVNGNVYIYNPVGVACPTASLVNAQNFMQPSVGDQYNLMFTKGQKDVMFSTIYRLRDGFRHTKAFINCKSRAIDAHNRLYGAEPHQEPIPHNFQIQMDFISGSLQIFNQTGISNESYRIEIRNFYGVLQIQGQFMGSLSGVYNTQSWSKGVYLAIIYDNQGAIVFSDQFIIQ